MLDRVPELSEKAENMTQKLPTRANLAHSLQQNEIYLHIYIYIYIDKHIYIYIYIDKTKLCYM